MNKILLFLLLTVLFACGEKPKEELIDLKDIISHQGNEAEIDKPTEEKDTVSHLFNSALANELGFNLSGLHIYSSPMFPDRFNPKSVRKLVLMQEVDSTLFCQWSYKDSIATKNAFYNWIDCFGPTCKSIKVNQKINFQKDNFAVFLNDTSITYISSSKKMNYKDWQEFFVQSQNIQDWKLLIHQSLRGKANWSRIEKGKYFEISTVLK